MKQRLNWLMGVVAIVVASVAISTTVTLWLVREEEKVEHAELKSVVDEATKQLRRVVFPNTSADHAHREAERAIAVAAVRLGVPEHRVEARSRSLEAPGAELAQHYFTVTDKDGGNAVCLSLHEQEKKGLGKVNRNTVYEPRSYASACPSSDEESDPDSDSDHS